MTTIPNNKIRREDVLDTDFVDSVELASDGYVFYRQCNLLSSTLSTKTIVIDPISALDLLDFGNEIVQPFDIVILSETTRANEIYTVNEILDSYSFTVFENILDSTDGYVRFYHPAGSTKVGVDSSPITFSTKKTLQGVLEDLSSILNPTDIGQMLFVDDSDNLVFKPRKPVVSGDGFIITDNDGNIIVI